LAAYRDFIKEVRAEVDNVSDAGKLYDIFDKWNIDTENQIDNVPRIWITRPESL
jgi:hypothetical protein